MAAETIITIVGNLTADPELRFTPSGAAVASFTVGGLRDWLLSDAATPAALAALAPGLTPEMVAAVSKLMRNQDLILVCRTQV